MSSTHAKPRVCTSRRRVRVRVGSCKYVKSYRLTQNTSAAALPATDQADAQTLHVASLVARAGQHMGALAEQLRCGHSPCTQALLCSQLSGAMHIGMARPY